MANNRSGRQKVSDQYPNLKFAVLLFFYEPKVMLILDNCSAHTSDKELVSLDGTFCATIVPPNTASLIEPRFVISAEDA